MTQKPNGHLTFSGLIGIGERTIRWGNVIAFFMAVWLSHYSLLIRTFVFDRFVPPFSYWAQSILTNIIFVVIVVAVCRLIVNDWGAVILSAVLTSAILTFVRYLIYPEYKVLDGIFYSLLWFLLFLVALTLAVRLLKPPWFALLIGYFTAAVIDHLVILIRNALTRPDHLILFKEEAITLFSNMLAAGVFAAVFWIGLKMSGLEYPVSAVGAPILDKEGFGPEKTQGWIDAANLKLVARHLKAAGIGSIVFGLIAVVTGGMLAEGNPINAILALIGFFLIAEGIYIIVSPGPRGLIADGIALMFLGIWNIVVTVSGQAAGGTGGFFVLGIAQVVWGLQSFRQYARYSHLAGQKPSAEIMKRLDETLNQMSRIGFIDSEDIIEFTSSSAFKRLSWKGKLLDGAILLAARKKEIHAAKKNEITIIPVGEKMVDDPTRATLEAGKLKLAISICRSSLERFQHWRFENPKGNENLPG